MSGRRRLTRIIPLLLAAAVLLAAATALLLLSPAPGHAQTTDDCAGDTTTTCSVSPGSPVTGDIEVAGDDDYFSLSVTSGVTYQINLEGSETSKGTLGDPYLFLRDASDDTIVRDDYGGAGYNARLTWTADRTGTVYVRVEAAEVTDTGTYVADYIPESIKSVIRKLFNQGFSNRFATRFGTKILMGNEVEKHYRLFITIQEVSPFFAQRCEDGQGAFFCFGMQHFFCINDKSFNKPSILVCCSTIVLNQFVCLRDTRPSSNEFSVRGP